MNPQRDPQADLRAFRWPLVPLERKLHGELESARAALAGLRHEARAVAQALQAREREHASQARALAAAWERRLDPQAHREALRYLAMQGARLDQHRAQAAGLDDRITAVAKLCLERDRQLGCVRKLREAAEALHAKSQRQRQAREADLAWLARHANASRPAHRRPADRTAEPEALACKP